MATYTRRNGAWWVRWRERRPDGGWCSRSTTIRGSERDAQVLVLSIEGELEATGTVTQAVQSVRPPASLLDGLAAFVDSRVASGRYNGSTEATYRSYIVAIARALYEYSHLSSSQPLPVTVLEREAFRGMLEVWERDKRGRMATYAAARLLLEAWRWMADDLKTWPHTPQPPRENKDYLPLTPSYRRTDAPTLAHVDAMLRRLSRRGQHPETVLYAVACRYLGWRGSQVAALQLEHLDLVAMTATVETGKSRRELAERRVVPMPQGMLDEPGMRDLLTRAKSGPVFRGRGIEGAGRSRRWLPSESLHTAWSLASEHDQVPDGVWNPPQRKYARPVHSLRAAYQAHMRDIDAPEDIIDYLVGHKGKQVRDVHYGRQLIDKARPWVDKLPAVQWTSSVIAFPPRVASSGGPE